MDNNALAAGAPDPFRNAYEKLPVVELEEFFQGIKTWVEVLNVRPMFYHHI